MDINILAPEDSGNLALNLRELARISKLEISEELLTCLAQYKILNLDDIRKAGGLSHLEGLPVARDHPTIRKLEAHAILSLLPSSINLNAMLIEKGYTSLLTIAKETRPEFIKANQEILSESEGSKIHISAQAQVAYLNNTLAYMRAELANGRVSKKDKEIVFNNGLNVNKDIDLEYFGDKCQCRDCESAVSPLAYLADLLNYAITHIKKSNGEYITLRSLIGKLHQPLSDLPVSCVSMNREVRQIRICIEVLRQYVQNSLDVDMEKLKDLPKLEDNYCLETYKTLLTKIGTSYEDMRLISESRKRKELADLLGIDNTFTNFSYLSVPNRTESSLERVFGIANTKRHPISDGPTYQDDDQQLIWWNLYGVEWDKNTSELGTIHVCIKKEANNTVSVKLFRDGQMKEKYAEGWTDGPEGIVEVFEVNNSGLSGTFQVDYKCNASNIYISAIPIFLCLRLKHLRSLWREQDWPNDDYSINIISGSSISENSVELKQLPEGLQFPASISYRISYDPSIHLLTYNGIMEPNNRLLLLSLSQDQEYQTAIKKLSLATSRVPIIDPDVIGPDDFRVPNAQANTYVTAFSIWLERRKWVDNRMEAFSSMKVEVNGEEAPDMDKILNSMYLEVKYGNYTFTPWAVTTKPTDLEQIQNLLIKGLDPELTKLCIEVDLGLTVESFNRLMTLRAKDKAWKIDQRNEKVKPEEWNEIYSILVQAQKTMLFPFWCIIENSYYIRFSENDFWFSLREPSEGNWPPIRQNNIPLIDPDLLKLEDLPEPTAGEHAISLWKTRFQEVDQIKETLRARYELDGFEAMLQQALNDPHAVDYLNSLNNELNSSDSTVADGAENRIKDELNLTVETFVRLMAIKAKNDSNDNSKKPSSTELSEVYAILTQVQKKRTKFSVWIQEESDLEPWLAYKAKLPKWRASAGARQAWHQALQSWNASPLIDPDLIDHNDLKFPLKDNIAYEVWKNRDEWIKDNIILLKKLKKNHTKPLAAFDAIIRYVIGIPVTNLEELDESRQKGESIQARLSQLNITSEAFNYLIHISSIISGYAQILESEWSDIYSIMVQVLKQRSLCDWRMIERKNNLIHGPDFFKFPEIDQTQFKPLPQKELPKWRASQIARNEWQDVLQSRIDQQIAVTDALKEVVSATEEATLPMLREALINVIYAKGLTPNAKAKWLTEWLMIDVQAGACQKTTRISQAIESVQGLLWSGRTCSIGNQNYHLDAPNFDEEWQWISSYSSWRAAMFVFLYPENILLPTLREYQTPGFRKLVASLQGYQRITSKTILKEAKDYSNYFRDVTNLWINAACYIGEMLFMFALGGQSNTLYWSIKNYGDQKYWTNIEISGLNDIDSVVGAISYYSQLSNKWFIYIFILTDNNTKLKNICCTVYNVNGEDIRDIYFEYDIKDLELPKGKIENTEIYEILVRQQSGTNELPRVAISLQSSWAAMYERGINEDGDWADIDSGEWKPVIWKSLGSRIYSRLAMIEYRNGTIIIAKDENNKLLYRLINSSEDDLLWRVLSNDGDFRGAFLWPGSFNSAENMYFNDVYILWQGKNEPFARYAIIKDYVSDEEKWGKLYFNNIYTLEAWIGEASGLSLGSVNYEYHDNEGNLIRSRNLLNDIVYYRFTLSLNPDSAETKEFKDDLYKIIDSFGKGIEEDENFDQWKQFIDYSTSSGNGDLSLFLDRLKGAMEVDGGGHFAYVRNDARELCVSPNFILYGFMAVSLGFTSPSGMYQPYPWDVIRLIRSDKATRGHKKHICVYRRDGDILIEDLLYSIAPYVLDQVNIEKLISEDKNYLKVLIEDTFLENEGSSYWNHTYLEEAFYYVPIYLALQLKASDQFMDALDWFRTIYDYTLPEDERKIYFGLKKEETLTETYQRGEDWLVDPLNPHSIAYLRARTYTKFTLLSLASCFLDYADSEFTFDTAESIPKARSLYEMAISLLNCDDLKNSNSCEEIIGTLDIDIEGIKAELFKVTDYNIVSFAVNQILAVNSGKEPLLERINKTREIIHQAKSRKPGPKRMNALVEKLIPSITVVHNTLLANSTIANVVKNIGKEESNNFFNAINPRKAGITGTYGDKISVFREYSSNLSSECKPQETNQSVYYNTFLAYYRFCIPLNPMLSSFRLHAEISLYKLRTCRNIAGMLRQIDPYAAPTDTVSGMPTIGSGGQLILPGKSALRPTPYRYSMLIERAKQLVNLAQQIETSLLSIWEKRDAEYYNLLKARQDLQLAKADVRLQDLKIKEAEGGIKLAELQRDKSQVQKDIYSKLIEEDISDLEQYSLELLGIVAVIHEQSAIASFVGSFLPSSVGATGPSYSPQGSALAAASSLSSTAVTLSTLASIASTIASYERRKQEWEIQKSMAEQDLIIGAQQISIAQDQLRVVGQERSISKMRADYSEAIVNFLSNEKFTSFELYDWMSKVMESIYSYFLQQATSLAQLSANQLAFERQETLPQFIQGDYWEAPQEGGSTLSTDNNAPDRRGLTGSARLLRDIYQLDQYAFDTNKRKLQLSKTFSLARLSPAEFQRFRETGVMNFSTNMEFFDRDFPGHYLRLIKRVKTSVIALIPPTEGIKATLTSSGLSRVVIGGDIFQKIAIRGNPDSIALTSPRDSTGTFELEPQSDLLFPFEGIGVDTSWEFRMPRAANLFDYNTIADVLITIEYTALNSFDYRQQVIQAMKPTVSFDQPFSFRHELADQWYDLHNPGQTSNPMTVRWITNRNDFPSNLENLKIQHILLYFSRSNEECFEVPVNYLYFTEQDGHGSVGGEANSIDGVISTRKGNAGSWMPMIGKVPYGEWELALPNTEEMRDRFKKEIIDDILFVITFSGRTPDWPA